MNQHGAKMEDKRNPFNPSFGKIPPVFIGREEIADMLVDGLRNPDSPYQTTIISGVRGVGKTVLLTDICKKLSSDPSWVVVEIPSNSNILGSLVQAVRLKSDSSLKKAFGSIDEVSLSEMGFSIAFSPNGNNSNYQLLLEQMLKRMQKQEKHLLIAMDEAYASEEMKRFVSVYQIMVRYDYPISMVMTGLPKNISELQSSKVLTFLLRCPKVTLPMLDPVSVSYSYKKVFSEGGRTAEQEALKKMARLSKGYPYAFQLLGYLLWETKESNVTVKTIESVMDGYKEGLFRNAYSKIYEELSSTDREFVRAMASSGKAQTSMQEIAEAMGKKPNYVSTYRRRLMESGAIAASSYGHVEFSLPLFDEYVMEFQT